MRENDRSRILYKIRENIPVCNIKIAAPDVRLFNKSIVRVKCFCNKRGTYVHPSFLYYGMLLIHWFPSTDYPPTERGFGDKSVGIVLHSRQNYTRMAQTKPLLFLLSINDRNRINSRTESCLFLCFNFNQTF